LGWAGGAKVAIVTGAGRGIGRAICLELARREWRLVLVARGRGELLETQRGCGEGHLVWPADLLDAGAVDRLVPGVLKKVGRLDALVNNAGMAPMLDVGKTTPRRFREVIELNLTVPFVLARAGWEALGRRGGAIVNISSLAALDPFEGFSAYAASKAGLNSLTASLAREGAKQGIAVHSVAPGAVETGMFRLIASEKEYPKSRTLLPGDVARVVARCVCGELEGTSGRVIWMSREP
jgi:NAD(P)-dependent dehydrogenase (short-subunit alcohol dehydrogenase family)